MSSSAAAAADPAAAAAIAHHLSSTLRGALAPFDGLRSATVAQGWITKAEYTFAAAEGLYGVPAGSVTSAATRLLAASAALTGDANSWFLSLPAKDQPRTWASFADLFKARFVSTATTDIKLAELRRLTVAAHRMRDKLNVDGLRRYTAQFLQTAAEIPDTVLTTYMKRMWYAEGLSQRHAQYVLTKNRSAAPPELHTLADEVIARAQDQALSADGAGSSAGGAGSGSDSMQLDAITLAATSFGVSREQAAAYFTDEEGWAPHHTDGAPPRQSAAAALPAQQDLAERLLGMERMLAAFSTQAAKKDVPDPLASERQAAGLCIRCGIAKYTTGNGGHNSRTCKAAADTTTTVAEGKRRASLPSF